MRKIYVVGGNNEYANWLEGSCVDRMEEANLALWTGGEDVSPELYGKNPHPTTGNNIRRDRYEIREFNRAKELGIPMLAICRGSQLMCCLAGGKLVQHQSHPYLHEITTSDGRVLITNSTHHQRQCIKGIESNVELLAWAENISPFSYGESNLDLMDEERETEIAYYKVNKALAIQGHPEMLDESNERWAKDFVNYCRELVEKYLNV